MKEWGLKWEKLFEWVSLEGHICCSESKWLSIFWREFGNTKNLKNYLFERESKVKPQAGWVALLCGLPRVHNSLGVPHVCVPPMEVRTGFI